MRILSIIPSSTLAVLVAFTASSSASLAADTTRPRAWCWWDGTAPVCEGGCGTARAVVYAKDAHQARNLLEAVVLGARDNNAWRTFGKACVTGTKAYCCATACPNGYTMVDDLCKKVTTKTRGLELPVPEDAAKTRKKGPIVAPGPVEETELNKGPIMAPGPVEGTNVETGPIVRKPGESGDSQAKQTDVVTPEESKGPSPFGGAKPYVTKRKAGPFTQD